MPTFTTLQDLDVQGLGRSRVLQVVTATTSTEVTVSSSAYTDTTLTATITPKSAMSKVVVQIMQGFASQRTNAVAGFGLRLLRDAVVVWSPLQLAAETISYGLNHTGVTAQTNIWHYSAVYVDSPGTTAATTYKTQGRTQTATTAGTVIFQDNGAQNQQSTIILWEVEP